MGHMRYQAMLVNSWDPAAIQAAHEQVRAILARHDAGLGRTLDVLLSPVIDHAVNAGASFFVAPDGSKARWTAADAAERARGEIADALNGMRYVDWMLVEIGGDDNRFAVLAHRPKPEPEE